MRKVHDVLRLHFGLKMPQRQIARSIQVSQSTVSEYLTRFEQSGLSWPLPEGFDDHRLQQKLFGAGLDKPEGAVVRPLPDFEQIRHELATNRHTSLQLLWEEYREAHPDHPYSYTSFWRHYDQWRTRQDLVMRQQHRAGEKLFVDWAGAKIPVYDRETGEAIQASLFVAVMGASSYTYAEATTSQEMEPWIGAHVRTFEFLGGSPEVVVPDNARTAVTKACRYEPDLNPTYLCTGLSRNQYKHKLEERGLDYDKADEGIYDKLRDRQPTALKNAQRLEAHWRQSGRGLPERENPSTSVHQLVDVLNDLAALPPAH